MNRFYSFIIIFFGVLALASCGSDDNEDEVKGSDVGSLIVGEWSAVDDGDDVYLTFSADGSCESVWIHNYDDSSSNVEYGTGTYRITGKVLKTHLLWEGDNEYEDEVINIVLITETTMILDGDEFGGSLRFSKVK